MYFSYPYYWSLRGKVSTVTLWVIVHTSSLLCMSWRHVQLFWICVCWTLGNVYCSPCVHCGMVHSQTLRYLDILGVQLLYVQGICWKWTLLVGRWLTLTDALLVWSFDGAKLFNPGSMWGSWILWSFPSWKNNIIIHHPCGSRKNDCVYYRK